MLVGEARAAAETWVHNHSATAYYTGSTTTLPDNATLPVGSDVDIAVVTDTPQRKPGKFLFQDVLLEVTYVTWQDLHNALGDYHLANGLRTNTIIADPTGALGPLQASVAHHFSDPMWLRHRCEHAKSRVEQGLTTITPSTPWPRQVMSWLFPTGITTHILLVAAQQNPTVRLRYLKARPLAGPLYPTLLSHLGCTTWTPTQTQHHLTALVTTFDHTVPVSRTPFPYSSDITQAARPIAIDGCQALIDSGNHREAVFWLTATFSRCHTILESDAPALHQDLSSAFDALLADLGITGPNDLQERAKQVIDFLPELWSRSEELMAEGAT
ncbi:hypothetical protein [Umezawaea sp. NPDC059074]|uniref:hypothetical protein n=1 Tax=Umezawaea sp. NPDC059074 TaxID=3346716 RepID=UPI00369A01D0